MPFFGSSDHCIELENNYIYTSALLLILIQISITFLAETFIAFSFWVANA